MIFRQRLNAFPLENARDGALGAQFCTSPQARPMLRLFKREFFAIFDDWILSIRRVYLCKDDVLRNAVESAAIPGPGIVGNDVM